MSAPLNEVLNKCSVQIGGAVCFRDERFDYGALTYSFSVLGELTRLRGPRHDG